MQLYRYRAATSQLEPLNAVVEEWARQTHRVSPDGNTIAFFGKPANTPDAPTHLYLLDLRSNEARGVVESRRNVDTRLGFAFDVRDGSLLLGLPRGDSYEIASISPPSDANSRVLVSLTDSPWAIDIASDGSIYIGTVMRPFQILRFSERGISKDGITVPSPEIASSALELPDGRFLATGRFDGHYRLLAVKPSGEIARFVETSEQTRDPAALIADSEVAFVLGKEEQSIAIASIENGRIVKRLKTDSTASIVSLSASSDGSTVFYSSGGWIWSIPTAGERSSRKLGPGDGVAFDPRHRDLVVHLNEKTGVRFVRMSPSTGDVAPIPVKQPLPVVVAGVPVLASGAVRRDGRIVFTASSAAQPWFLTAGTLDPETGNIQIIPSDYQGDIYGPSWNSRGGIVAGGILVRGSIWRFRPDIGSTGSPR